MSELREIIKELAAIYKSGGIKTSRFSITLSEKDNARLEHLADRMQISKQEIISKLLLSALSDLETEIMSEQDKEEKLIEFEDIDEDDLPF